MSAPWEVQNVEFDPDKSRIDFKVCFKRGSCFTCPSCGAKAGQSTPPSRECGATSTFFSTKPTFIPTCHECAASSALRQHRSSSDKVYSELFEALVITLCRQMPVNAVATHLNVSDDTIWRMLHHLWTMPVSRRISAR
ncbi:transposase family protein [endosymbiont of Ridgeia piscesae]|uniref:transposase family protein n=1 Tax=endosymbiont of Ridgeia piscesae TaxID=54398 RepID=UPI0038CDC54C